jgi:hypothetical protein
MCVFALKASFSTPMVAVCDYGSREPFRIGQYRSICIHNADYRSIAEACRVNHRNYLKNGIRCPQGRRYNGERYRARVESACECDGELMFGMIVANTPKDESEQVVQIAYVVARRKMGVNINRMMARKVLA